jgi:CDP-diacylglycerol--glycerol-3-phosphate 3-phosphatidyltransferase
MRITANQVTFARLILMPGICVMVYGGETAQLWAVILGTIVGCTDFVDGYLARKQGPTVLGGLMDPIADKVFIAIGFMPFADLGLVAWWLVVALFLREFLVTALRSSFELRQRQLKSTYLAKLKTWVQMVGLGVLLILRVVHSERSLTIFFGVGAALPIVATFVFRAIKGRWWRGAWIFAVSAGGLFASYLAWGQSVTYNVMLAGMVGITWASAIDYVVVGAREVMPHMHAFDFVRLAGAAVLPVVSVLVLVRTDAEAWPLIAIVALEFAHGGLDNLLAHHGVAASASAWGARLFAVCGLLGAALALPDRAQLLSFAALAVTTAATAVTFFRQRRFYLEQKLREKKRAPAPAPAN